MRFAHRFNRSLSSDSGATSEVFSLSDWHAGELSPATTGPTMADLRSKQAFLLVGELGVGKTWLFANESERLRPDGAQAHFVRLGEFGEQRDLDYETFSKPAVRDAIDSGELVYLFLDSLDQGLIQIPRLDHWLYRRCRDLKNRTNMRVRISSRMSPEVISLGAQLSALYSVPQGETVYYLQPLTESEIVTEARAHGLDGSRFVELVSNRNAEVLATHPLTLSLLLRRFSRTKRLEGDIRDLYRDACLALSSEHEAEYVDEAPASGELAYTLTTRLAALTALTGAQLISLLPASERPPAALGVEAATSLPEASSMGTVDIRDDQIRYVLTNAHFQLASTRTYRWSHMGLQDFMAAEWLTSRMSPEQIQGLLVHPLDPGGQIRPELEEVAAWLAGMLPAIRDYLLLVQPMVLLTSRAQAGALTNPNALLKALLTPANAMRVRWFNVRDFRLRRLRSSRTTELVRDVLLEPNSDADVLWLALAVVRQLRLVGLDEELLEVTVNRAAPEYVAVSAGLALEAVGSVSTLQQLAIRLEQQDASDLPDEIKAAWLRATKNILPVSTFFRVFTAPRDDVLGLYDTYDAEPFITRITAADIPQALRWVAAELGKRYLPPNRSRLLDAIMLCTVQHLKNDVVRSAVKTLLIDLGQPDFAFDAPDIYAQFEADFDALRSIFVDAMHESDDPLALVEGSYWRSRAWMSSLTWQRDQLPNARTEAERNAWLWLIERTPATTPTEVRRGWNLTKAWKALAAAAKAKFTTRRPGTPDGNDGGPFAASETLVGHVVWRRHLEQALDHAATSFRARIDVVELVSEGRRGDGSRWDQLPETLKGRVNELMADLIRSRT